MKRGVGVGDLPQVRRKPFLGPANSRWVPISSIVLRETAPGPVSRESLELSQPAVALYKLSLLWELKRSMKGFLSHVDLV